MPKITRVEMIGYAKKAFYIWAGVCMVLFGIAGLILPIIPGIVPIAFGITLLAKGSEKFNDYDNTQKLFRYGRLIRAELSDWKKIISRINSLF